MASSSFFSHDPSGVCHLHPPLLIFTISLTDLDNLSQTIINTRSLQQSRLVSQEPSGHLGKMNNISNISAVMYKLVLPSKVNSYSTSHDNWCTATLWNRIMTAQCEGMGEVGSARYEPAQLPPCLSIRVLSYSNCQEIHLRQQTGLAVQVLKRGRGKEKEEEAVTQTRPMPAFNVSHILYYEFRLTKYHW